MQVNRFLPFALIYFFFNTVALPFGLTWMAVLAPFFYLWVIIHRKKEVLLPFLIIMLPFMVMHIAVSGVELKTYIVSMLNIIMVYIACQAFYTFFISCNDVEKIFRTILVVNFFFCLAGIIFYFTPWDHIFWIEQELTRGVRDFRRFKLFTYEASYYATLFIPVFFFFLLQYVFMKNRIKNHWLLPMLFLPFILSFSLGVISAAIIAGIVVTLFHSRQLLVKRRIVNMFINAGILFFTVLTILVIYFRHNPLFTRLLNVVSGDDSSAKGRTADSFYLARQMLDEKNEWWGIGVGHVKLVGHDIVHGYYLYTKDFVATIPNALAETLAVFGWVGLCTKLFLEMLLFFVTKPWTNYYRLMLFVFIFIYQFTGSFLTNLAEYMIWILAFTNVFPQFDRQYSRQSHSLEIKGA